MGLNKFEKELRNKLNNREITPSKNTWDRLDAMLAVTEGEKPKKSYNWLYVAATILGFLFIGTVFFTQMEEMVDKGKREVVFENNNPKPQDTISNQVAVSQANAENIALVEPKSKTESNQDNQNHQSQSTLANPVEAVSQIRKPELIASSTNSIINQKAEQPAGNPKTEQSVTVKLDELLVAAQNQNAKPKTSVKVNAQSLLSEVDHQVNLSFREKMLRRASEVADAVSNRNNQE